MPCVMQYLQETETEVTEEISVWCPNVRQIFIFRIEMCASNMKSRLFPFLPLSQPPDFFQFVLLLVLLREEQQDLPLFCSWIKPVLEVSQVLTFRLLTVFKCKCFIDKSVFVNTNLPETHLYCSLWIRGLMHVLSNRNSRQSFHRILSLSWSASL